MYYCHCIDFDFRCTNINNNCLHQYFDLAGQQFVSLREATKDRSAYQNPSALLEQTYPALKNLTQRQLEILALKGIPVPDSEFRVVDLSQNLAYASISCDKMPCVTPEGAKFLTKHVRFSTGIEALRFQGIWLNHDLLSKYSSGFLQDLAGNAYEATTCAANVLCNFVFLAQNRKCQELASAIPKALAQADDPEPFDFEGSGSDPYFGTDELWDWGRSD